MFILMKKIQSPKNLVRQQRHLTAYLPLWQSSLLKVNMNLKRCDIAVNFRKPDNILEFGRSKNIIK
jgi:hypothetical protein